LTAVEGFEVIRYKPQWKAPAIGLVRAGMSVALRGAAPLQGPGVDPCSGGWYAVVPRGFVCRGPASTLARDDPRALAAREALPDPNAALPFRVGTSLGAPRYLRIPTRAEQRTVEKGLDEHLARSPGADDKLADASEAEPAGVGPSAAFLRYQAARGPQKSLLAERDAPAGMRLAWAREFDAEGRTWLETPDLALIPKDKVRVAKPRELHGVDLRRDREFALPLAFLWLGDAPKLEADASGRIVDRGDIWPRHAFVPVTGELARVRGVSYYPTRDGHLLKPESATLLRARSGRPAGVGPTDKWVSVRITWGTLVAYEGDTPVFATAISPGVDGIGPGDHATRRGLYRIGWKMRSYDMSGEDHGVAWTVKDVPWVAYYKGNYALHGAWWHDGFGRPMSHGCINLPPEDARFLFEWLDPALPEGWYGAASYYPEVKGTVVEIGP
jgi:hypothetical protein